MASGRWEARGIRPGVWPTWVAKRWAGMRSPRVGPKSLSLMGLWEAATGLGSRRLRPVPERPAQRRGHDRVGQPPLHEVEHLGVQGNEVVQPRPPRPAGVHDGPRDLAGRRAVAAGP